MPIASPIASAAHTYRQNEKILGKTFLGLTPEEWQRRPGETSNPILWVVGHVIWARSLVLGVLGSSWTRPWLPLFVRGAKLGEPAQYPSPDELLLAWQEVSESLTAALEGATEEALSAPAPEKMPTVDGKVSGVVGFLAFHETYHVGQAAYIRTWLGHDGVTG